jgi:hypothetical protein
MLFIGTSTQTCYIATSMAYLCVVRPAVLCTSVHVLKPNSSLLGLCPGGGGTWSRSWYACATTKSSKSGVFLTWSRLLENG